METLCTLAFASPVGCFCQHLYADDIRPVPLPDMESGHQVALFAFCSQQIDLVFKMLSRVSAAAMLALRRVFAVLFKAPDVEAEPFWESGVPHSSRLL